jgi:N utilization substance protein B
MMKFVREKMTKGSRSLSRRFAIEILYQMQMREVDMPLTLKHYQKKKRVDITYLEDVIYGINSHQLQIKALIGEGLTNRSVEELDAIESAILNLGVYELAYRYDIPYKVIIDESINLTKIFGGQDSHRLINSVLDVVSKKVRKLECGGSAS